MKTMSTQVIIDKNFPKQIIEANFFIPVPSLIPKMTKSTHSNKINIHHNSNWVCYVHHFHSTIPAYYPPTLRSTRPFSWPIVLGTLHSKSNAIQKAMFLSQYIPTNSVCFDQQIHTFLYTNYLHQVFCHLLPTGFTQQISLNIAPSIV